MGTQFKHFLWYSRHPHRCLIDAAYFAGWWLHQVCGKKSTVLRKTLIFFLLALVIWRCLTNNPQAWQPNTICIYYLTVYVGRNSDQLSWWFWPKCNQASSQESRHLKPYLRVEDTLQSCLPSWLLAGGLSSSPHGPLHRLECAQHMPTGFPQSKLVNREQKKPQCLLWPSLKSHPLSSSQNTTGFMVRDYREYDTKDSLRPPKLWPPARFSVFFSWTALLGPDLLT
jgi:hypothetical protein